MAVTLSLASIRAYDRDHTAFPIAVQVFKDALRHIAVAVDGVHRLQWAVVFAPLAQALQQNQGWRRPLVQLVDRYTSPCS